MSSVERDNKLAAVPVFPLPNVVLFPRAILPLHIFEERYKLMTADAIDGDGLIAMALFLPGWEKTYHARPAIQPIVCVGKILSWEKLPDGKYNFLLQGQTRARVLREYWDRPYRQADLAPLQETHVLEIDLELQRSRLGDLLGGSRMSMIPIARQLQKLIASPLTTAEIADLAAFNLLDDVDFKQVLLEEKDVRQRVDQLLVALEEWAAHLNPGLYGFPVDPGVN